MRKAAIWGTALAATAAIGVGSAQAVAPAVGPPPDPGFVAVPHCTVPKVAHVKLAVAERRLAKNLCVVGIITRKHSSVKKGRVVTALPRTGTQLAAGTSVDLVVSLGRRA